MTSETDNVYTVHIIGAIGESIWGAYTDEQTAIRAAKKERWMGDFLLDSYVERVPLDRSAPSTTVWESWESDKR